MYLLYRRYKDGKVSTMFHGIPTELGGRDLHRDNPLVSVEVLSGFIHWFHSLCALVYFERSGVENASAVRNLSKEDSLDIYLST
ncbi:hypothetical protein Tco_0425608, partial [Tanacetum coccineum]